MCGIVGIFSYASPKGVDRELLIRMRDSMVHRGPDDEGAFIDNACGVGLAHRRLSIIDLSGGKQPMSNSDRTVWLTFNGEIYNFVELRNELETRGYRFRTKSDTEVIICLYQEYGESAFGRLNGIFSFGLFDKGRNCLILARDHFGIKPMYYCLENGTLRFASEIKAILKDPSVRIELDYEALNSFLTFRYNPSPQTLLKGIRKLPPASYLKVQAGGAVELNKFWDPSPVTNEDISEGEAVRQYQNLLEQAVRRQMISDVPVGLLLSGGVDSAVTGYLMQSHSSSKVKTFTVGFEGSGDYNELSDARVSADFIGSEHFDLTISQQEYLDFFFRSFYFTEEPIAEPTIPALYYVSQLASQHLKVVLAGQGADEPLAGYKRHLGEKYLARYAPLLKLIPLHTLTRFLPRNERLKRLFYAGQFPTEVERFLAIYTIFTPQQKLNLLNNEAQGNLKDVNLALVESLHGNTSGIRDPLSRMLYIDTRMSLSDDLLIFGDKMSMANSLEMRVPFLDVELVQFLESLPTWMKLKGNTQKYIHKRAVEKWLPYEIIFRKKRGFYTPMDKWLQNDLAAKAKEILTGKDSACREYFNMEFINSMLDKHKRGKENYQKHIFALLSFELWHKMFLEERSIEERIIAS